MKIDISLHDMTLRVEPDNDGAVGRSAFGATIRALRSRGWTIGADPETKKRCPTLSRDTRAGRKGDFRLWAQWHPAYSEFSFWAVTWPIDNRSGPRYDFNKRQRLEYLDRLRFSLEIKAICTALSSMADVTFEDRSLKPRLARDAIEQHIRTSWHYKPEFGRADWHCDGNRTSADKELLNHGQTVYFAGRDGRVRRGRAFYNLNNMWWVQVSPFEYTNKSCFELWAHAPDDLRTKRNERVRRAKLERLLAEALTASNYDRAKELHRILFGEQRVYRIWSRKNDAFYAPNYSGYSSSESHAGRYTKEEAEAEVRRVPHILSLVTPEGRHVRFEQAGAL